jgi:hypothetical protein
LSGSGGETCATVLIVDKSKQIRLNVRHIVLVPFLLNILSESSFRLRQDKFRIDYQVAQVTDLDWNQSLRAQAGEPGINGNGQLLIA